MVFKPFSHLARRSTKAFAHGYAQSLAAASQSSYASTQTPLGQLNHYRLGKTTPLQQRESYHQNALQPNLSTKANLASPSDPSHDGSLETYFTAWQKHQNSDEWQQVFSNKRPERRGKSGLPVRLFEKDEKSPRSTTVRGNAPPIERAHSASALDDIRKSRDEAEAIALRDVDEAISKEIGRNQPELSQPVKIASPDNAPLPAKDSTVLNPPTNNDHADPHQAQESAERTAFVDHISFLEQSRNYGEIPGVFEAMLRSGLTPPSKTYNSLLVAAVRLSPSTMQVIPKALTIYSNMLRQHVTPDSATYTLLLELLSLRALEVVESKELLNRNRLRFRPDSRDGFLLSSRETELDIAMEDGSLSVALQVFDASSARQSGSALTATTYRYLLEACAKHGEIDQMIRIYSHMESNKVVPLATSYPPMIRAFAASGDLRSAVECYNEYKALAVADDGGRFVIRSRADQDVYSALVSSYLICGKTPGAQSFLQKVIDSLDSSELRTLQHETHDVILESFVDEHSSAGRFEEAFAICSNQIRSSKSQQYALEKISGEAADRDVRAIAEKAYGRLAEGEASSSASISMLAMYLRNENISSARKIWSDLSKATAADTDLIEPTVAYSVMLIDQGSIDEGLFEARSSFSRIRRSSMLWEDRSIATELIDEGIECIANSITKSGLTPSPQAAIGFLWAMVENGGLLTSVAEQLLVRIGPRDVDRLDLTDLKLALQVEAGIIVKDSGELDVAHIARFAHILETAILNRMPIDERTSNLIDECVRKDGHGRPDLVALWESYSNSTSDSAMFPGLSAAQQNVVLAPAPTGHDGLDPYATTLDQRGSSLIVDELEKQGSSAAACLQEALARLRNMRRAGRHPRYIAYAKLVAAAARESRTSLVNDLFGLAKQDMPLLAEYPVVRHGWTTILDSMIAASLIAGDRTLAAQYHQQLLDIGAAPTANTFGLYITTLKESTKTFDEATEAVRIFLRAKSEGVEPSSFLYNALIGKLGKARRIDDCLFYFAEMRSRGVRPTSVTYGTIVNALCRVSDERFAEELFDEMESMPNYKPRPAPYNSMMQFFLTTKRDSSKVLEFYGRMRSRNIQPTMHTYKLLIDTYATLEPINLPAAEAVFDTIRASGQKPENIHYASLVHAKGCVLHDMAGARAIFDSVVSESRVRPHACLYQALFESMVANHCVKDTEALIQDMDRRKVEMTAYIANTLIHGWALEKDIQKAGAIYNRVGKEKREPSTYEAMTRALLTVQDREGAVAVVQEMLSRGYPSAVSGKILELLGHDAACSNEAFQGNSKSEASN
ncbi:hypothetical protein MMC10_005301 [Thelotrema lepadinum]|nr:hypothetical protein [Thelotrema lepadinum]